MREQTSVIFKITSMTLTAQDIQARTGLVPNETWKIGTLRGRFAQVEKAHGFTLESKAAVNASLDEHVKAMLKRLAPHAQQIGALTNEARIEFACIVHRKTAPAMKFERDDLRWLGVMGARLDIDIYIMSEPQKPAAAPKTGQPGESGQSGSPTYSG